MRDSERLFHLARKCFEDAAESSDPGQMKIHAEMGRHYLQQAEAAVERERKSGNGGQSDV